MAQSVIGQPAYLPAQNAPMLQEFEQEMEAYVPLPDKKYNVTNTAEFICGLPCVGASSKTLVLDDQEATLINKNCCCTSTQRRPYAQLGSVDVLDGCNSYSFSSDLITVEGEGRIPVTPGCGSERALVDEIVAELQDRKLKRGNVMQMRKLDYAHTKAVQVAQQMPGLLQTIGVPYTPSVDPVEMPPRVFQDKSFDVTNNMDQICSCATTKLDLGPEEAFLTTNMMCGTVKQHREYAQLGNVTKVKSCGCCYGVSSQLGMFTPGWGCDGKVVSEVVEELQERMYARGTIGQIKKQEAMMAQLMEVNKEMELVCQTLNLAYPPSEQDMAKIYGSNAPSIPPKVSLGDLGQQVEPKTYDVTDKCAAASGFLHTCGLLGCTKQTMELRDNEMVMLEKNNCVDMDVKVPYAQLGSVDYNKECFCCYAATTGPGLMISPGWGCDKHLTQEIAAELQSRKVKRGNIAQLKQLEWMNTTALELDIKSDLWLNSHSMSFPPPQQVIQSIYGSNPPRVLTAPPPTIHLLPSEQFELKHYNVTNSCEQDEVHIRADIDYLVFVCMCTCGLAGCPTTTLDLEADETYVQVESCCCRSGTRTPYAHLGSVDVEEGCCGMCHSISGVANPGCGCSRALVSEIAEELQNRKVKRGNIAQLKMQENIMNELVKISAKTDVVHFLSNGK